MIYLSAIALFLLKISITESVYEDSRYWEQNHLGVESHNNLLSFRDYTPLMKEIYPLACCHL